ncbi:hypothetical protein [Nonomuraea jabiensis]|uniref:hypothetical protein n=1 Tax=Nonomuraea jabiensis TaxID=882448 RepID=UPI003D757E59
MSRIPTDHPNTRTLASTSVCLRDADLPPLNDECGRPMHPDTATIIWEWNPHHGWLYRGLTIVGLLQCSCHNGQRGSTRELNHFGNLSDSTPDHGIPPEYLALVDLNRPHAWAPFPPTSPATAFGEAGVEPAWQHSLTGLYGLGHQMARLIADTLRLQFPDAAYLVLFIDEEMEDRDYELFPHSIRDANGEIIYDFSDACLPPIDDERAKSAWGHLNPRDAFQLRWLLRQLYIVGHRFDNLPEDLLHEEDGEVAPPCLLLSEQARPHQWEPTSPQDIERLGPRLLRPCCAPRPV